MFQRGVWRLRWARERSSSELWCQWYISIIHCSCNCWRRPKRSMDLIRRAQSQFLAMLRSLGTFKAWLIGKTPFITIIMLAVLGFDYYYFFPWLWSVVGGWFAKKLRPPNSICMKIWMDFVGTIHRLIFVKNLGVLLIFVTWVGFFFFFNLFPPFSCLTETVAG